MSSQPRLGDYTVLGRIGTGATAEILLAERAGVRVALKRLHPHLRDDADVFRAFMDEARLVSLLQHPGIVRVLDLLEDGDDVFTVLELVDGPSLLGAAKITRERGSLVPLEAVAHVIEAVADALAFVHAARDPRSGEALAVVHRDVAPANLLIDRSGAVKLTDFGIARSRAGKRLGILSADTTRGGVVKGRRGYVAPEQIMGEQLDARADLYSLGVVVWELLAGRRMHEDINALDLIDRILHAPAPALVLERSDTPEVLASVIDHLLKKAREDRPANAREVAERMRAWRADRTFVTSSREWVRGLGLPSLLEA
jgi:serine/threonine-protein kinase